MTQSKPNKLRMTVMLVVVFFIVGLLCIVIFEWATDELGMNILTQFFLTVATLFTGLFFILIELPIILALTIDDSKIVVKNLLTRKKKTFLFANIDSFKISTQFEIRGGLRFELILLRQGKGLGSVSLKYIDNLSQIINELEKQLQNLTKDEYGFLRYVKEHHGN